MTVLHHRRVIFRPLGFCEWTLSHWGFSFIKREQQESGWLCKWIVANSLWAERPSSHSGVINPLLTHIPATSVSQPWGDLGLDRKTRRGVPLHPPSVSASWDNDTLSSSRQCIRLWNCFLTNQRTRDTWRDWATEDWNQISLLCNVL